MQKVNEYLRSRSTFFGKWKKNHVIIDITKANNPGVFTIREIFCLQILCDLIV